MDDIKKIREEISEIDKKIAKLLKKRQKKVLQIGKIKISKNLPITDKDREEKILSSLETDFEKAIFKKILTESRKIQL